MEGLYYNTFFFHSGDFKLVMHRVELQMLTMANAYSGKALIDVVFENFSQNINNLLVLYSPSFCFKNYE